MYYISHVLLCMCFLLFIIKNTARCRCVWKWNFRTNFTQSVGHSVTFHIHSCMNSYYIAYYCKELDYFPPLLNGVNVVGCGSASLPTWITHSLGEGIRYDFIDNVLCRFSASPASQVNGRCAPPTSHPPLLIWLSVYPVACRGSFVHVLWNETPTQRHQTNSQFQIAN